MKRICVVTNFKKTANYGAILQAYALNTFVRNLEYGCLTLSYAPKQDKKRFIKYNLKKPRVIFSIISNRILRLLIQRKIWSRTEAFDNFRNGKVPHTEDCNQYNAKKAAENFDVYICGSDQIWRPGRFNNEFDDVLWLRSFDQAVTKISYAASIGVTELDENKRQYAKAALSEFYAISVREESAAKLLQPMSPYKKIETVLDPVFLLTCDEWNVFSENSKPFEEYIFVYFINPDNKSYSKVKHFAKMKKIKIISFPYMAYKFNLADFRLGGKKIFDASPQDFVWYIKNASYIMTDSFHASAFSIIFHKDFYVYITNHATRIQSMLTIAGLNDRILSERSAIIDSRISLEKWNYADKKIDIERRKSIRFLLDSLAGEGDSGKAEEHQS